MPNLPYLRPVLLGLVLLLGLVVRVAQFPGLPPGLNQDEAASAYEAYSLAETGKDKWGNELPAYFPAWGSGQNVLLAYLTVPVIKVFGLSIASARGVMLVLGLLALPLLFYCLRPLGWFAAWLGTLLLAVVPWHFMLTRWGLESNVAPFFMLLGCTALTRGLSTQRWRWIVPALLPFALSLYAYGTTIVVLPVLLGLVLVLGWQQLRPRWGSWLLALGLFGVVSAPFGLFFVENYLLGRNLPWTDHLFFATPLLPASRLSQVAGPSWRIMVGDNVRFLLAGFDDGTCYNNLPGFRPLLHFTLPFVLVALLVGGWQLARQRSQFARSPQAVVLLVFGAWGVGSLGLVCFMQLNTNRFNHAYLPCLVLAAWAAARISSGRLRLALRLGLVLWPLLEGGRAVRAYFTSYPHGPIQEQFRAGLPAAFAALRELRGVRQVYVTQRIAPLNYDMYTLFYLRYPPARFQRERRVELRDGVYQIRSFGRYVFAAADVVPGQPYGYLAGHDELPDTAACPRQVVFRNERWEVGVITPGR
ncbi:MAG: hypothetical protein ACRYFX_00945 [Janthinobacterium lividum]